MISVSIVSHGHGAMVDKLIQQLGACPEVGQIILTRNIPETSALQPTGTLEIINNQAPAGFGANHNEAFKRCREPFFCVVNPDIELSENPLPGLLACLAGDGVALVAPLVFTPDGRVEDSIRHFPTLSSLFGKAVLGVDGRYIVVAGQEPFCPEWVAGMFMLFSCAGFKEVGGFDTGFFLYYEDVDICARLWKSGAKIVACPSVGVTHAAQRESHRKWCFLRRHLASMVRYFYKHLGRLPDVYCKSR
jgi:hypothetical protein